MANIFDMSFDAWDDSELIKAYDESVRQRKGKSLLDKSKIITSPEAGPWIQVVNREREEKNKYNNDNSIYPVGSPCRAKYSVDGIFYEAKIKSIRGHKARVRFVGYANEEDIDISELKVSNGKKARDKQRREALEQSSQSHIQTTEVENYLDYENVTYEEPEDFQEKEKPVVLMEKVKKESVVPQSSSSSNSNSHSKKRDNYLNWDDYFMSIACLSSMRSKDPSTQVGACIVNKENRIVGIGYNGMPTGCSDDEFPWGKESDNKLENKYLYVCHAEMNAIMNRMVVELKGCRIYLCLFPCNECAKLIIQSGIKNVIYYSNKNWNKDECIATRRMFDKTGVIYSQYQPTQEKITIDFTSIDWNKSPDVSFST